MRRGRALLVCLPALAWMTGSAAAETPRVDYRVVYARAKNLGRQLESASRDGYACVAVARPDPGVAPGGVVVILGRTAGAASQVANRTVATGWGKELQDELESAGGEGFRLCGIVLDEGPNGAMVAVLSKKGDSAPAHYVVEVLKIWKESLVRLRERAAEGFQPVAAASIDDNRVPDMRTWLVVAEKTSSAPREVAVRSNSLPGRFGETLNESAGQGYRLDAAWKDGNDFVAMMSRPKDGAKNTSYLVDTPTVEQMHWVKGLYLSDLPYKGDERVVVSESGVSASTDVEDDALPKLTTYGTADAEALETLGNHLGRHSGFAPVAARIRHTSGGGFKLLTVLVSR